MSDSVNSEGTKPDWWMITVPEDEDGTRLDRFIRRMVPGLTQGPVEKMLRSGLIRLDGAKAKPASRLEPGQQLRLPPHLRVGAESAAQAAGGSDLSAPSPETIARITDQFNAMLVAEGEDWLAINKPSGLAVQGGSGTTRHVDGMLMAMAQGQEDRIRLVHRIDKDTSGLLLLARGRAAARRLTKAFQQHDLDKTYLALVNGVPPERLRITGPLAKGEGGGRQGEMMMVRPDGQPAHTEARRLDHAGQRFALMALRPLTGRTHQLRVHMAHEGHAIIGDGKYGGAAVHPGGEIARRLHLHAWRLQLPDGKRIEAPLSAHMTTSLEAIGLALPPAGWQFPD